ncbi:hypothetical protein EVA_13324 [gut metagenome]|uniref:Uncharacterized protein n=1 Tax=gut metagenome TaxID=749906 RepID=J9GGS6_9ZZZZ
MACRVSPGTHYRGIDRPPSVRWLYRVVHNNPPIAVLYRPKFSVCKLCHQL